MLPNPTGVAFARPKHSLLPFFALTLAAAGLMLSVSPAISQHEHHGGRAAASSNRTAPEPGASGRSAVRHDNATHADGRRAARKGDAPETLATREFKVAHARMMRNMDLPYTGDPDVDFRVHMVPHHQAAIDMAEVVLRHSKNPWTRHLAESVIIEQKREITEMQAWLALHGARVPAGGQTTHVIGSQTFQREAAEPGNRAELVGQSWAPGTGVPAR